MNEHQCDAPKHSKRAQEQRERILDAAQECFIKHGFHAAGMAMIAKTADMSPGLIYRYFDSKNAIIIGIIERQLENSRTNICSLYGASDFTTAVLDVFNRWRSMAPGEMSVALFLEMTAESSRNPSLAAALRAFDAGVRKELCEWLSTRKVDGGKEMPAEVAQLRALSLQSFMGGLAIRAIREPDLDQEELKRVIEHFASALFSVDS